MNKVNFFTDTSQIYCIFQGCVAATNNCGSFVFEEKTVTSCTVAYACTKESVFTRDFQFSSYNTCSDNNCLCLVFAAIIAFKCFYVTFQLYINNSFVFDFSTKANSLFVDAHSVFHTAYLAKSRVVFNFRCVDNLAAVYICFKCNCFQTSALAVNCSSKACRACADNSDIINHNKFLDSFQIFFIFVNYII